LGFLLPREKNNNNKFKKNNKKIKKNNNNNTNANVHGAIIMAEEPLREFTRFI